MGDNGERVVIGPLNMADWPPLDGHLQEAVSVDGGLGDDVKWPDLGTTLTNCGING